MTRRRTHTPEAKAKVALEAIREEMRLAELSKNHGVLNRPEFVGDHQLKAPDWKPESLGFP